MPYFRADLHIHTLTSPCGSLEMSPCNIVQAALEKQLDIIGITDHNCTKQASLVMKMGKEKGLLVIGGAEINTLEEVHCLVYFDRPELLDHFQSYIDQHLPAIANKPEFFGHQIVVNEEEMITEELPWLLTNALDLTLTEIEQKAHSLGGLVVPAHVDRPYNGLFSQLGFLPENFKPDAFELSMHASHSWKMNGKIPADAALLRSSDAHYPHQIGTAFTLFEMQECSFEEIKKAVRFQEGRRVVH
ncbi:MAG: PHP domain-containing protein [Prolixibacteraceae bacterium]|nr:PHP domain-containing protein [Prolixibacteraceae bacterium]